MRSNFRSPRKNLKIKRTALLHPAGLPKTAANDIGEQNRTLIAPALKEESKNVFYSFIDLNKCQDPPSRAPIKLPQ